jgi:hypothetical protein
MDFFSELIKVVPNGLYYILLAYAVWFVAKFYFVRFCNIEKQISSHGKDVVEIKTDISKINISLLRVVSYICTKDNNINPGIFSSNSPLHVTPKGMEILKDSGGIDFIDGNLESLIGKVEAQNPATNYDVQQKAFDVIFLESTNSENFKKIKEYAYQNPVIDHNPDRPLSLFDIVKAMGIYLRDKFLEKHPELK